MRGKSIGGEIAETSDRVIERLGYRGLERGMWQRLGFSRRVESVEDTDHCKDHDHNSDDTIDQPHRPEIKMTSHLIDEETHHPPPREGTDDDEEISNHILPDINLRELEIKTSKKSDYQEDNQGIGDGEQETVEDIALRGDAIGVRFFQRTCGVRSEEV